MLENDCGLPLVVEEEPSYLMGVKDVHALVEGANEFVRNHIQDYSATLLWKRWNEGGDTGYCRVMVKCREHPLTIRVCIPNTTQDTDREVLYINGEKLMFHRGEQCGPQRCSYQSLAGSTGDITGFDIAQLSVRRFMREFAGRVKNEINIASTTIRAYPDGRLQDIPITYFRLRHCDSCRVYQHNEIEEYWRRYAHVLPGCFRGPQCNTAELALHRELFIPVYYKATSTADPHHILMEFALLDLRTNMGLDDGDFSILRNRNTAITEDSI